MDIFEILGVYVLPPASIIFFIIGMIKVIKDDIKLIEEKRIAIKQINININGKSKPATLNTKQGSITLTGPFREGDIIDIKLNQ